MPRDSNSNYTLPPIYLAVTGQTVLAEQHNTPLTDIAAAITGSLARNGTGSMLANLPMGSNRITNLASGTAPTDASTVAQAQAAGTPIATVVDFVGVNGVPTGWLLCAGQAVSRTDYPLLFAALGTFYGAGNGSTTFNLPDLRGRVTAGMDDMGGANAARLSGFYGSVSQALGGTLGTASHVLTAAQMPSHRHQGNTDLGGDHNHGVSIAASGTLASGSSPILGPASTTLSFSTLNSGPHDHSFGTDFRGSDAAHPNAQPTIITLKIIKAFTP